MTASMLAFLVIGGVAAIKVKIGGCRIFLQEIHLCVCVCVRTCVINYCPAAQLYIYIYIYIYIFIRQLVD